MRRPFILANLADFSPIAEGISYVRRDRATAGIDVC